MATAKGVSLTAFLPC